MGTFLFDAPVFGPINSRRLGVSLGINLLPKDGKLCSFNCLYCECGLNEERRPASKQLPSRKYVQEKLEERLTAMQAAGDKLNVITFAGNGEPTLHPDFSGIIDDTIALRDLYFPEVKISVLANSVHLDRQGVVDGLAKVDNNILKLDSAIEKTFYIISNANATVKFDQIVPNMSQFDTDVIVQTLFCKGKYNRQSFDNTSDEEVAALIEAYKMIQPKTIMIYSLSRDTPVKSIYKVEKENLELIATKLRENGFTVEVS
ncbi:MAG: radical SAM protein [Bacteroidales bacterium]|jgi:wyosine [tRNA(Phe)-imidazoG37] synthetase (radical SAM superfamily)|nr:radical SAM protein [Bacteroidales bacterium]